MVARTSLALAQTTIRPSDDEPGTVAAAVRCGSRLSGAVVALVIAGSVAIATSPVFGSFFAFGIPGATLSATTSITAVLFVGIHGPLYIGMPMLFVTVSCAIAWARVVRCLATSEELR